MGRDYAGVLGLLAFATIMARGLIRSAAASATLWQASLGMFLFAFAGAAIGAVAGRIVDESVRGGMAAQAAAQQAEKKKAA